MGTQLPDQAADAGGLVVGGNNQRKLDRGGLRERRDLNRDCRSLRMVGRSKSSLRHSAGHPKNIEENPKQERGNTAPRHQSANPLSYRGITPRARQFSTCPACLGRSRRRERDLGRGRVGLSQASMSVCLACQSRRSCAMAKPPRGCRGPSAPLLSAGGSRRR